MGGGGRQALSHGNTIATRLTCTCSSSLTGGGGFNVLIRGPSRNLKNLRLKLAPVFVDEYVSAFSVPIVISMMCSAKATNVPIHGPGSVGTSFSCCTDFPATGSSRFAEISSESRPTVLSWVPAVTISSFSVSWEDHAENEYVEVLYSWTARLGVYISVNVANTDAKSYG